MGTVAEQPAEESTLEQDIAADFEAMESDESTDEIVEEAEIEAIPEETDDEPEIEASAEDTEEVTEDVGLTAPEHWDTKHKEMFNGWEPAVKEQYMERHKEMEGRLTQGLQEVSEYKNELGDYWNKYSAQKGALQAQGVTTSEYLTNLTEADLALQRDPVAGIKQIARSYGVDLSSSDFMAQESNQDPEITSLRNELSQLKGAVDRGRANEAATRQSGFEQQIQEFSTAEDDTGQLKHPHFNDVVEDMVSLAMVEHQQGRAPDLAKLYEQAVWSNPETREKNLSASKADQEAKDVKRAREKAAKAKAASASPSTKPDVSGAHVELSLEEQLSALYDG